MVCDKPSPVLGDGVDNIAEKKMVLLSIATVGHAGGSSLREKSSPLSLAEGLLSEKRESVVRFLGESHRERH